MIQVQQDLPERTSNDISTLGISGYTDRFTVMALNDISPSSPHVQAISSSAHVNVISTLIS